MISMTKKYRTRDGLPVRVLCTDANTEHPVVGLVTEDGSEWVCVYSLLGVTFTDQYSLIEVSPYEDYRIDEPVMVLHTTPNEWCRRHFAGVNEQGRPETWKGGQTSWSTTFKTTWTTCRRPTAEELK